MALGNIFRVARLLGDKSSLEGGYSDVASRVTSRVGGRGLGKFVGGLSVHNLFIWAGFFSWLRSAVEESAKKPVYVVNSMRYAKGYNSGFRTIAKGRRLPPPGYGFWDVGLREAMGGGGSGGSGSSEAPGASRSGLYIGGRFAADIRSIYKGNMLGRVARRSAGAETSRFFWGTLSDPNRNVNEAIARRAVRNIRRNIRQSLLVDTEAMVMATQWGNSMTEALEKSRSHAVRKLMAGGITKADRIMAKVDFS